MSGLAVLTGEPQGDPLLGSHNAEVYGELGLDFAELRSRGIV